MHPWKTRLAAILTVLAVVLAAQGCSAAEDGPAVLPDDPVCQAFPADQLAPLLPGGTYAYFAMGKGDNQVVYSPQSVILDLSCRIISQDTERGDLYVYSGTDLRSSTLAQTCHNPLPTDLALPRVGLLVDSGTCTGGDTAESWVVYWSGQYGPGARPQPKTTLIDVSLTPREGRDGVADATQVVQMVLDLIDRNYAATPPDYPQTTPRPVEPSPADSPTGG